MQYKRPLVHFKEEYRLSETRISHATLGRGKTGENTERTSGARSTRIEGRHKIIETSWLGSIPSLLSSL